MKNCRTCKFWEKTTDFIGVPNDGVCGAIKQKVTADLVTGWDGGYVRSYETEEDFCCSLYVVKEDTQ